MAREGVKVKKEDLKVRIRMVSVEEGKRIERLWEDLSKEEQQEILKKFIGRFAEEKAPT